MFWRFHFVRIILNHLFLLFPLFFLIFFGSGWSRFAIRFIFGPHIDDMMALISFLTVLRKVIEVNLFSAVSTEFKTFLDQVIHLLFTFHVSLTHFHGLRTKLSITVISTQSWVDHATCLLNSALQHVLHVVIIDVVHRVSVMLENTADTLVLYAVEDGS